MILDTCALLFLASGDRRLSRGTRERLDVPVVTVDPKFAPYGVEIVA